MSRDELSAYEAAKGRAICGAIRLGVVFGGLCGMFPAGCWLMLEATGWPQWGGAVLCTVAGVLVDALPGELRRVKAWTREAERLKWQEEAEFASFQFSVFREERGMPGIGEEGREG